VDILSVDAHGNTLLHIALSSLKARILGGGDPDVLDEKVKVVKHLVTMAGQARKKLQILFGTRNKMHETIFSFGVSGSPISQECERFLKVNRNDSMRPFVTSSTISLSEEAQQKIQESSELQSVLAYWEYFYEGNI